MGTAGGKLIVLDRDGVINYDSDEYIKSPQEWIAIPGSIEAIAKLHHGGFRVVVASNQSGVARGLFSEQLLDATNALMTAEIEAAGGALAGIYCCPHHPDAGCDCRKPAPGLLRRIGQELGSALNGVALVGDKLSDIDAALAVDARPILVTTGRGAKTSEQLGDRVVEVFADLAAVANKLLYEIEAA